MSTLSYLFCIPFNTSLLYSLLIVLSLYLQGHLLFVWVWSIFVLIGSNMFLYCHETESLFIAGYYYYMREQYANRMRLKHKYMKPNIPIMTPRLIRVYQAHTSQLNLCNVVTSFDKNSAQPFKLGPVWNIFKLNNPVCLDVLWVSVFSSI